MWIGGRLGYRHPQEVDLLAQSMSLLLFRSRFGIGFELLRFVYAAVAR
jgi:hypothetical protein